MGKTHSFAKKKTRYYHHYSTITEPQATMHLFWGWAVSPFVPFFVFFILSSSHKVDGGIFHQVTDEGAKMGHIVQGENIRSVLKCHVVVV